MAPIVHDSRLDGYSSYKEAIIGPVMFPLAFACIAQIIMYLDLVVHRCTKGSRSVILKAKACGRCATATEPVQPNLLCDMPVLLVLPFETIFAVCCIVQCTVNWAAESFVGKELACNVQGFYVGYYVFGAAGASALALAVCVRILDNPTAMTSAGARCVVVVAGLALNAFAIVLGALPLMGVGEYLFAYDYCLPNVEAPFIGAVALVWLVACLVVKISAAFFAIRSKFVTKPNKGLLIAFVAFCLLTWGWMVLLVCSAFANGHVAGESWTGNDLYAPLAMLLHTNQLVVPIYFGWVMRSNLYQALRVSDSREKEVTIK